jgi:hypothetical protein
MATYRLYRNVSGPFMAYRPGQNLWFDPTEFDVADALGGRDAEHALDGPVPPVLDAIFARHNRDDRPDGPYAPSLSVGDVIALDWAQVGGRFFSVDSFGFTEVEGPMLTEVFNAGDFNLEPLNTAATYWEALQPYIDEREAANAAYRARSNT